MVLSFIVCGVVYIPRYIVLSQLGLYVANTGFNNKTFAVRIVYCVFLPVGYAMHKTFNSNDLSYRTLIAIITCCSFEYVDISVDFRYRVLCEFCKRVSPVIVVIPDRA